jgi:hypothetical protein
VGGRMVPAGAMRDRSIVMLIETPVSRLAEAGTDAEDGARETWRDGFWAFAVGAVDACLRRLNGIDEFCDDPACLIRIAPDEARRAIALSDGAQIRAGDPVGVLHLWNEHLPRFPVHGPDLRWASEIRRRVERSLAALAVHIEADARWREARALRADAAFLSRIGAFQMSRVARRHGFEAVAVPPSIGGRLHAFGENFLLWGLARAYNPPALRRRRFLCDRHEVWISRERFLARYGRKPGSG